MKLILAVDAIKPPLTGIGRYVWELATRMALAPAVAEIRFFRNGGWVDDPATLLQQSATRLALRKRLLRNRLAVGAYRLVGPLLLRSRLRAWQDHVFHGPNFYLPQFPGRGVATIHDLSIFRYPEFHPAARVEYMAREIPLTLRRADLLITDSEFVRREVIEFFGWPAERIVAIPLGAPDNFHPRSAASTAALLGRLGIEHGRYCLCVATVEPRKNIAALVLAYASLPQALRTRYPLVLAGDPGWHSEAIHREIDRGRAQGWLHYLGYLPEADLPQLFAGARGFALPSLYEGFGLPVLEAMKSGVPVLTSRDSALSELARGAALLVDPHDVPDISQGLLCLLEDDQWRQQANARGAEVSSLHSWDTTVQRTLEAYRTAAGGA